MRTGTYYDNYWSRGQGTWSPTDSPVLGAEACLLRAAIRPGDRVLDVGCGDGRLAETVRQCGGHYAGIDIAESAVARCREKGLEAARADFEEPFPFDATSLDVALIFEVLEHLFEPERCLREACRVLRAGGRIIGSVPNAAYIANRVLLAGGRFNPGGSPATSLKAPWRDAHIRFFTRQSLTRLLREELGLEAVRVTGQPFSLLELPVLYRTRGAPRRVLAALGWPFGPLGRRLPGLFSSRLFFAGVSTPRHP